MKRGWLLLLILSLGLNLGLLFRPLLGPPSSRPPLACLAGEPDTVPPGRPHGEHFAERRLDRLVRQLGLDPAQRERLAAIRRTGLEPMMGRREAVHRARLALLAAYRSDPTDTVAVRTRLAALGAAQARVDSLVAAVMLRELAVLTPAQREAYLEALPWEGEHARGAGRGAARRGRGDR
ncbi:MAG: Spy/CpxP family protein refolding chaperone [Candidatus Krumholzibacteriia bacterium]